MTDRNARVSARQRQNSVRRRGAKLAAVDFFNLVTGPELLEITDARLPEHRERLYPPTVTLAMFMKHARRAIGTGTCLIRK